MKSSSSSSLLLLKFASGIRLSLNEAYNFKQSLRLCFYINLAIHWDYLYFKSTLQSTIQARKIIPLNLFISLNWRGTIIVNYTWILLETKWKCPIKRLWWKSLFSFINFFSVQLSLYSISNFNFLFSILEFTVFLGIW